MTDRRDEAIRRQPLPSDPGPTPVYGPSLLSQALPVWRALRAAGLSPPADTFAGCPTETSEPSSESPKPAEPPTTGSAGSELAPEQGSPS